MRRKLTAMLMAAALCLSAVGCAAEPKPLQTLPPETTTPTVWTPDTPEYRRYEGVELTFLSCWQEDDSQSAVLTQAAEVFQRTTGAQVQIVWGTESYETGDIFQMPGALLESRYRDHVLDLTQMIEEAGLAREEMDIFWSQILRRGGCWNAVPQVIYVSGFYYNAQILDECGITALPSTYGELLELCAKLLEAGYSPMTLDTEGVGKLLMLHLSQYLGIDAAGKLAQSGGWAKNMQPLEDIWAFAKAGYVAYDVPGTDPEGRNRMALSNCAFLYGTNALCGQVEADTRVDLRWGMFPYPGVGGGEPVISVDADVLAISSDCAHVQAAFDWITLLTTGEFDQLRVDLTNGIPADPDNTCPISGVWEALSSVQVVTPVQPTFTEKQETALRKLWQGKYQTPEEFAEAMDRLSG